MEASQMKPGMWIRCTETGMPFRLTKYDSKHYGGWHGERLSDGAECFLEPAMCQHWVPKLGEFVRVAGCDPFVVTAVEIDRAYGQLAPGLVTSVAIGALEPAPMPKAEPVTRTPIGTVSHEVGPGLYEVWINGASVGTGSVLPSGLQFKYLPSTPAKPHAVAYGQVIVGAAKPKASADRCKVCGGGVYVGLNDVECNAGPACKPVQTEPTKLYRHAVSDSRGFSEMHWRAEGRGQWANHPTEEGAIAAWREKVVV